jgi:hypothetical protein
MKTYSRSTERKIIFGVLGLIAMATTGNLWAHCDTLDGPVAIEARTALETGDVSPLLKWVPKSDEQTIKDVFTQVLQVRQQGSPAKELAERYFLETLIRIHRAGEGAPYTGLKPTGTIEPAIAAADKAIDAGSVDALAKRIANAAEEAIKTRFIKLKQTEETKDQSPEAGRKYVAAYVEYIHFIEGLHDRIAGAGAHHTHSSATTDGHNP